MNLIGSNVKHTKFGIGRVVDQSDKNIWVKFALKTCVFPYPDINTFGKFLTAEDPKVQTIILQEIVDIKAGIEAQKRAEEDVEEQPKIEMEKSIILRQPALQKKVIINRERIQGKRMTFYVFQGNTFDQESRGGYIWAPIVNKKGNTFHHWDRLLDVLPGDIILHGCVGYVQAVSIAKGKCYECSHPKDHNSDGLWEQDGRRVDCEYITIKRPIKTSSYVDDIVRLCNVKYAPFDKYGNGNMGYLYELNQELARIFLRSSAKYNDYLNEVDYIHEFIVSECID